jgi:phosphogluconate dehydratase
MSGASGKVAAAIQLHPEALKNGNIAKLQKGDLIEMDIKNNALNAIVDFEKRELKMIENINRDKLGADMFSLFRKHTSHAEKGASILGESIINE